VLPPVKNQAAGETHNDIIIINNYTENKNHCQAELEVLSCYHSLRTDKNKESLS